MLVHPERSPEARKAAWDAMWKMILTPQADGQDQDSVQREDEAETDVDDTGLTYNVSVVYYEV